MRVPLKTHFINTLPICTKTIAFLVNKRKFLCDSKLINILSYYFKIEIIYIGALVSMNYMFSTLITSLCIRYLSNNLKKSSKVMSFPVLSFKIFVFLLKFMTLLSDHRCMIYY